MAVCMLCGATITQVSLAVHDTSVQHLEACLRQWEVLALRVVRHGLGWRGHRGTLPDMTVVELQRHHSPDPRAPEGPASLVGQSASGSLRCLPCGRRILADPPTPGSAGRARVTTMKWPTDPPDGLLIVPFGKGCLLLLTPREYLAGLRRRHIDNILESID